MSTGLVVFDLDGTVVDSMGLLRELAVQEIATHYGHPPSWVRALYDDTVGIPFRAQLERMFPKDQRNDTVAVDYEAQHLVAAPTFPLAPGIKELVRDLRGKGWRTALVSSTHYRIIQQMPQVREVGFDLVQGFCPHCERTKVVQISHAVSVYRAPLWRTVVVGDTLADGAFAHILRTGFILVTAETTADRVRAALLPPNRAVAS